MLGHRELTMRDYMDIVKRRVLADSSLRASLPGGQPCSSATFSHPGMSRRRLF